MKNEVLEKADLSKINKLLIFNEVGNVQMISDKVKSFMVKLQNKNNFWKKIQEKCVELEIEMEENNNKNIKKRLNEMFEVLLKLLMTFDEDLTDKLLNSFFFPTLIDVFKWKKQQIKIEDDLSYTDFKNEQVKEFGSIFMNKIDESFRDKYLKMRFLYQNYLCIILKEIQNEIFLVLIFIFK